MKKKNEYKWRFKETQNFVNMCLTIPENLSLIIESIYIYSCIDLHWTKKKYFVNLEKRQQQKFEIMVRATKFSFDSLRMVSVAYGFLWDNFLFFTKIYTILLDRIEIYTFKSMQILNEWSFFRFINIKKNNSYNYLMKMWHLKLISFDKSILLFTYYHFFQHSNQCIESSFYLKFFELHIIIKKKKKLIHLKMTTKAKQTFDTY